MKSPKFFVLSVLCLALSARSLAGQVQRDIPGASGIGHTPTGGPQQKTPPPLPLAAIPPEFEREVRAASVTPAPGPAWPEQYPESTTFPSDSSSAVEFAFAQSPSAGSGNDIATVSAEFEQPWQDPYDDLRRQIEHSVQPGTKLNTMKVVGRIHYDHWAFPGDSLGISAIETGDSTLSPQDRLAFRRIRFGVRGDVWENMEYRIEMEFAGGDQSQFRDVWIGFQDLPLAQTVRIGNQKRPYGLDHLNSSRFQVFIERPFIVEAFNQDARRLGVQSWGVSDDEVYNWRLGVFNQRLIQDEGAYISDHYQSEIAGRLARTCWYCDDGNQYCHLAVSSSFARPDGSTPADNSNFGRDVNEARFRTRPEARSTSRWLDTGVIAGADWYQLLGLEGVVNFGPLQIVGEHMNVWLQRDAGFGPGLHLHGGYAYISYFLTGEHIPWNRKTGILGRVEPFRNFYITDKCCPEAERGWGAWQIAFRWSYTDFTDDNVLGGEGQSLSFGMNWHWNPNARMQFNYIYGNIDARDVTDSNGLSFTGGPYHILGTRFAIDF